MPSGLTLQGDGFVTGTPSETGDFNILIGVIDGQSNTGSQPLVICIETVDTLVIAPDSLESGSYGATYSVGLSATGGNGDYKFSVSEGALPAGIDLAVDGTLSGDPLDTGEFTFTARVEEGQGNTGIHEYVLEINLVSDFLIITPESLIDGKFGEQYSVLLTASGGAGGYEFEVISGTLPSVLSLAPDGVLQGTPVETGTFTFDVLATDAVGNTGQRSYALVINPAQGIIEISPEVLPDGETGLDYSQQLIADGGVGDYTYLIIDGALPLGLLLDAETGLLSGNPQDRGEFNISVGVTDSQRNTGLTNYALHFVEGRDDPSTDPDIVEIIEGQFRKSNEFANGMIRNVHGRMDTLLDKLRCRSLLDDCGRFGLWQKGQYTSADDESYATYALGFDMEIHQDLFAGVALTYGEATDVIGHYGSFSEATKKSITGYFSYQLHDVFYIDGLIGYGDLTFSDQRYIYKRDGYEHSTRNGSNQLLSLIFSGDYYLGNLFLLSPYARYDAVQTNQKNIKKAG